TCSRWPGTHAACAGTSVVGERRDSVARRGTRSRLGILGCLPPQAPGHPAPQGCARSRRRARPDPALPERTGAAGHAERGLSSCDASAWERVFGGRRRGRRACVGFVFTDLAHRGGSALVFGERIPSAPRVTAYGHGIGGASPASASPPGWATQDGTRLCLAKRRRNGRGIRR